MANIRDGKKPFQYTYQELAKECQPNRQTHPYPGSQFKVGQKDCFYFLVNKDLNLNNFTGIKFHVNFGNDPTQFAKAWNAIVPLLISEPQLIGQAKMIIPEVVKKNDKELADQLKGYSAAVKSVQGLEEKERNTIIDGLAKAAEQIQSESDRRVDSTQVTIYIQKDSKGEVNIDAYKKLLSKIETALSEAGIPEAKTPESDFKVSQHISLRGEVDKTNESIDIYRLNMHNNWEYFKNHDVVKAFVSPDDLKKPAPEFAPEAAWLQGRTSYNEKMMKEAVSYLKEHVFLNATDWLEHAKGNQTFLDAISRIKEILEYKKMHPDNKFKEIINVCQLVVDKISRNNVSKEPKNQYLLFEMFSKVTKKNLNEAWIRSLKLIRHELKKEMGEKKQENTQVTNNNPPPRPPGA